MVSTIFSLIEKCDIFIADISIINATSSFRKTPNPNVLIELGYAARALGCNRIICLFNCEYAQVEMLPFDIRSRKPVIYNSSLSMQDAKNSIIKSIEKSIAGIVNNVLLDKREYRTTKKTVDLAMQAILIDFCKLLLDDAEKFYYNKLLLLDQDGIAMCLHNKAILGFYLFMNIPNEIKEFSEYFNDELETYFLSGEEKRVIAKLVFALKTYNKMLRYHSIEMIGNNQDYKVINGQEMNSSNKKGAFILVKPIDDKKCVVVSGGSFEDYYIDKLLNIYRFSANDSVMFSTAIHRIIELINEWIRISGNYFIANIRGIE